ncbi:MAG: DUF4197 domain-containing protein [Bacteroidia bacterium]|nr:DUF4197 domain-containing protein [Bacteroidia bacterium]
MKRISLFLTCALLAVIFMSCDKLSTGLTDTQIIEGLKSALTVGTDSSVATLSKVNGYYGDAVVKILLPPEADNIISYISYIPGGSQMTEDVILRINRAAEDAASGAAPVFIDAVTNMTIADAYNILHGDDSAATHYLRQNTWTGLYQLYQPKIDNSLSKPLVGGVSANDSWYSLTSAYNNDVVNTVVGQLAGLTPVTTDLSNYSTSKALDGLFVKIADKEKDIRHNPQDRVNDILKQVFGSLN